MTTPAKKLDLATLDDAIDAVDEAPHTMYGNREFAERLGVTKPGRHGEYDVTVDEEGIWWFRRWTQP